MTPRFTVSVLTYVALPQAKRCIASLLKQTVPFKLLLTANGNKDAAAFFREIAAEHPFTTVIENEKNQGFIEPNKHALTLCDTELFVMMNDDATLPPDGLAKLAEPFDKFPKAALSGPKDDFQTLLPSFHGIKGGGFEYLNGACLCCKTEIVRKHGLFDPNLKWAYGEDSDLSLRMRELGYTLHHASFVLQHEVAATSRHVPEVKKSSPANHAYLLRRWSHYIKVRTMDYPIVLKRAGAHGDVLLLTPVIRALKQQRPLSTIYVETSCPEVLANNPHLIRADRKIAKMPNELRIILDGVYEAKPDKHFVQSYAEAAGVTLDNTKTEIYTAEKDARVAEAALAQFKDDPVVAIFAGPTTWGSKNLKVERFREIASLIQSQGYVIALVGADRSSYAIPSDVDFRGQTSVGQLAEIVRRCAFMVSLDSFPLHVAEAVGTPVVGLFGVTDPRPILTGTRSIGVFDASVPSFGLRHKRPNTTIVDDKGAAMDAITVSMVMAAVETLTSRSFPPADSAPAPQTIQP